MIRPLILILLAAAPAQAAPDAVQRTQRALAEGEFEKAVQLAEKELRRKPPAPDAVQVALQLLRGQACAVLRREAKAKESFRAALNLNALAALDPESTPPDQLELFELARAEVEGELQITSNREDANVRIGRRDFGPAPLRLRLPVGRHLVEVLAGTQHRSEEVVVWAKRPSEVSFELPPEPPSVAVLPPPAAAPAPPLLSAGTAEIGASAPMAGAAPWVIMAGGAFLATAGAVGIAHSYGVQRDFRAQQDPSAEATVTRADAQRAGQILPLAAGLGAAGGGLMIYGVIRGVHGRKGTPTVTAAPSGGGAGVSISGRF